MGWLLAWEEACSLRALERAAHRWRSWLHALHVGTPRARYLHARRARLSIAGQAIEVEEARYG